MEGQKAKTINFVKLREFMRDPEIAPLEKCVLIDLLLYAGVDGEAFPSEEKLGKDLHRSDRQIRTVINSLKHKGLLDWKRRGYSKSNQYTVSPELYFRNDTSYRNSASVHLGTALPIQSGSPLPPIVSQENNQVSSELLQEFIKANKNTVSELEKRKFAKLSQSYSPSWIKDAIKVAANRSKDSINTVYLIRILQEWKEFGKPPPKPQFHPCNKDGCDNGAIFNSVQQNYRICSCKESYEKEHKSWKQEWGGTV